MQREQHRGAGLLLLSEEAVLVRQREVHARALHRGQRADRARELALEAALEGQALLELRLAELGVVHQLVADHAALGQAVGRELQAHVVHLVGRHQDRRAAIGMPVGYVHLRQLREDRAAVLVGQVGVQHLVVALRRPGGHRERDADQCREAQAEQGLATGRQGGQAAAETGLARCAGGEGLGMQGSEGGVHRLVVGRRGSVEGLQGTPGRTNHRCLGIVPPALRRRTGEQAGQTRPVRSIGPRRGDLRSSPWT